MAPRSAAPVPDTSGGTTLLKGSRKRSFFLTARFPETTGEARLTSWLRNPVQKSTSGKLLKTWVSLRYDERMLIGYARVSTHEQNLSLQLDALKKAGCRKVFDDKTSGARSERPGLKAALEYVREGETLLVWRLDRLGRSLKDLIEIIGSLEKRGVGLKSFRSPSTPPAVDALYSTSSARWRSSNRT
jgi:hypothetical protein